MAGDAPGGEPSEFNTERFAQRGFAASFQRSAFSDQLPICDKFAGWASWMSFSEPEVPEVQRLSAENVSKN